MKIRNFVHKGLKQLYVKDSAKGVSADAVGKLRKMLSYIDNIDDPEELRRLPTWKVHSLTGDSKGTWSMSVTAKKYRSGLASLALGLLLAGFIAKPIYASETVTFNNGALVLHGVLYKPAGTGPFPVVLYNHGSAPGMLNNEAFEAIAPLFTAHGWVFFAPYRRGQGLSSDAGPYIVDEIDDARAKGGETQAADTMVKLLDTDHLSDQMAALAWIKKQPFVQQTHIVAMGNSFGGIETVLGAEQGGYCAAVDAAGGSESWNQAPGLRDLMLHAVKHSQAPILFFQAKNDFNLTPSKTLYAAMKAANKPAELHIYPPFGGSAREGHSFPYRGSEVWRDDVLRFLAENCKR